MSGEALIERAAAGDVVAVARLITALESGSELGAEARLPLHRRGGAAHVVGITGAPGSGKSTLVGALVGELRSRGRRVGVVAVDPSSSLGGGAILGDRIRMQEHTLDPGVFLRSMSSRGALGGVSRATVDAVSVLDAAGWDVVIVETVGVGQADVEIVKIAHTTVVVSVPGMGDGVQAIKAGLLEVADLHVVNKADREGADRTRAELLAMLTLAPADAWAVPVLATSATGGEGVAALADTLADHLAWLDESGERHTRERRAAAARVRAVARDLVLGRIDDPALDPDFQLAVDDVVARRVDPHAAADALVAIPR